nr:reverse transcriptase domain-containing protein [Tanacetum cinerariifolium]
MPLSVWNKLLLPELSPTYMTLELADRLISRPVGVIEDVFVKVGTFHFPTDFVVVDFDADPRVPLILRKSFLKTGRALIDVLKGELTLRVGKEAITFNLDQPSIPQPQVVTTTKFTKYIKENNAILKNMQTNMTSLTNSKNMFGQFMKMNTSSSSSSGTLLSNTVTNPKEYLKGITTRSGNAYQGPTIPTTSSSLPQVVEHKTEVTKDTVPPTNNKSSKNVQPLVIQIETHVPNSEPVVASIIEPVAAPVSAPKPN